MYKIWSFILQRILSNIFWTLNACFLLKWLQPKLYSRWLCHIFIENMHNFYKIVVVGLSHTLFVYHKVSINESVLKPFHSRPSRWASSRGVPVKFGGEATQTKTAETRPPVQGAKTPVFPIARSTTTATTTPPPKAPWRREYRKKYSRNYQTKTAWTYPATSKKKLLQPKPLLSYPNQNRKNLLCRNLPRKIALSSIPPKSAEACSHVKRIQTNWWLISIQTTSRQNIL